MSDVYGILLRLESIRGDGPDLDLQATFSGKPNVVGNSISFPISRDKAARLTVGTDHLFVLAADVGYEVSG